MPSPRFLALGLAALVLTPAAGSQEPTRGLRPSSVAKAEHPCAVRLEAFRAADDLPGVSAAVALDGELLWSGGVGFSDLENRVPASALTSYRLASISKALTAVIAMDLVEEGKLDLEADVRLYVPRFPEKAEGTVRVRHLLCHQSGIRHYRANEMFSTRYYSSLERGLELFVDDPLVAAPGSGTHYTTYGYSLLGCAMERAGEASFEELLQERLARPLGLASLGVDSQARLIPHRAQGYARVEGGLANSALADTSYKIPGGGMVCNAGDLARLLSLVSRGAVLEPETRERMWTRQTLADGKPTGYGLGWSVRPLPDGKRVVGHTGAQQRVSTALWGIPEDGVAVAVLCNLEGTSGLMELAEELATLARTSR